jgi:hypothetical protein
MSKIEYDELESYLGEIIRFMFKRVTRQDLMTVCDIWYRCRREDSNYDKVGNRGNPSF